MAADHMPPGDRPLVPLLLQRLTRLVARHPLAALCVIGVITAVSLGTTARFLRFKTDRSDLIDPAADFQQRWLHYVERFGDGSDAVVVIEGTDRAAIQAAAEDIGPRLTAEPELFSRVFYRIEPGVLQGKSLQYLTPRELDAIIRQLDRCPPLLSGDWSAVGLSALSQELSLSLRTPQGGELPDPDAVAHAAQFVSSLSGFFSAPQDFQPPWPPLLERQSHSPDDVFATRYLISERRNMGFVLAAPARDETGFDGAAQAIGRLRSIIREVAADHPDVRLSLTGVPVLEADEMQRSQADMTRASIISFAGVGLLLLFGFRGLKHPLIALVMLAVGVAWSLGYTTLAVGHLNILSVSFAAILIGLGIDYAVHYIARYLELRHAGLALRPALVQSSMQIGPGIVTSSLTTAAAFFSALLTSFLGVAELGIIAGGGILLCAAATFLVLPALIAVADRRLAAERLPAPIKADWLRNLSSRRPLLMTAGSLIALVAVGACGLTFEDGRPASRVRYDANLLNLQAEGVESVETMNRIADQTDGSFLYAVSLADGPDAARRARNAFLELPTVRRVEEAVSMLPQYPPRETQLLVQGIHARLAYIPPLGRPSTVDPARVGPALDGLFTALDAIDSPSAISARNQLDLLLDQLEQLPLEGQVRFLSAYEQALRMAMHAQLTALAAISDPAPVSAADLPAPFRERFVSPKGDWLIKVYSTTPLWDEAPLAAFVRDVRTVDPDVTGTPLQNFEAARQIRESYLQAAFFAAVFVFLAMLIDTVDSRSLRIALLAPLGVVLFAIITFSRDSQSVEPLWLVCLYAALALAIAALFDLRNVGHTVLAMLPPFGGSLLLFGILGLCGIDLNPANLIVLPLVLGMGVDYGVYVVHDFRQQPRGTYRMSSSTLNAILLTSCTSMVGFGSMLGASHQGLVSLGLVLLIGIGCCMTLSLLTLPALLTLVSGSRGVPAAVDQPLPDAEPQVVSLPIERHKRSA